MQPTIPLDPTSRGSLLEELDARQDEVLAGLEELNKRLEQVLSAWSNRPTMADAA